MKTATLGLLVRLLVAGMLLVPLSASAIGIGTISAKNSLHEFEWVLAVTSGADVSNASADRLSRVRPGPWRSSVRVRALLPDPDKAEWDLYVYVAAQHLIYKDFPSGIPWPAAFPEDPVGLGDAHLMFVQPIKEAVAGQVVSISSGALPHGFAIAGPQHYNSFDFTWQWTRVVGAGIFDGKLTVIGQHIPEPGSLALLGLGLAGLGLTTRRRAG